MTGWRAHGWLLVADFGLSKNYVCGQSNGRCRRKLPVVIDPIRTYQEIRLSVKLPMHHAEILRVLFGNRLGKRKSRERIAANSLMNMVSLGDSNPCCRRERA